MRQNCTKVQHKNKINVYLKTFSEILKKKLKEAGTVKLR